MKIFIIEVDDFQRKILHDMIASNCDGEVSAFSNVDDCIFELAMLKKEQVVIFSDINLPNQSGITLIREIQRFDNILGIIVISALDETVLDSISMLIKQIGATYSKVLQKPVKAEELKRLLSKLKGFASNPVNSTKGVMLTQEELVLANINNAYIPYFQPQIYIKTGEIRGFEILGRLVKDGEVIFPNRFIEQLLRYDMISDYTISILENSIKLLKSNGLEQYHLSLNVEYRSLMEVDFSERILNALQKCGYPAQKLTIEITESASSLSPNVLANITELKLHSISIAIDDFGFGGSGINELLNIPYSELKLDRSHIAMIKTNKKARAIVESMANMTSNLNLACVAEGIENIEQLESIKKMDIAIAQGFLYSKAIPAGEIKQKLASINSMFN
ncbi:EAL domain-containing response regulator [Thalassotalea nanhaiensis]|uniref:EAL domain-containing response regulator n=1 Tax=Thalassotalea nanhaiensis TaxID=3065648 RepID=A0ABY9TPZ8_9GAMM|nr:EAL domain-containing response regulator [Colwelliaceae bacterium SQ345]